MLFSMSKLFKTIFLLGSLPVLYLYIYIYNYINIFITVVFQVIPLWQQKHPEMMGPSPKGKLSSSPSHDLPEIVF